MIFKLTFKCKETNQSAWDARRPVGLKALDEARVYTEFHIEHLTSDLCRNIKLEFHESEARK